MKRAFGLHEDLTSKRARAAFCEIRTPEEKLRRQCEIEALPSVEWKGKTLRTIRCCGETGNGPHAVNVPESVLWSLFDLRVFRCPYH